MPVTMTDNELDQCRHNGPLLHSIVSEHVPLAKKGQRWRGCCPFHAEKTPSFFVFDDGRYRCFGCGANGDVFAYVMQREHVDFPHATQIVAKAAGIAEANPRPKANGH